ncbi:LysR family transcriptional regulator [Kribbella sandramycini]|uniref:DNA-binding transcriptional LysR family regulator n=1 Tax=Kribbella sandramycini TaxID=60450 RepID=A0A7Y4NZD5_9ACTN|nr:LysR family transcriptional regulator [Kribbella sandramycini]MBB6569436.1 DNA-binding transcriptional LysR family regulator [Kribbella sandramycini]NOL40728.1 LysR family transcriptional regulator [Kribbella sandramycini]
MDPRRLLIFRTVARSGSLSAAAAELGWTQPAVGQHMQRLEREAGVPLLLRSARGITLTEAGTALLVHADAVAARLAAADAELQDFAALRTGSVQLVAFPSAAAVLVPPALAKLTPALDVRLTEAEPPEAVAQVLAGTADVGIVFGYADDPPLPTELVCLPLASDPLRAVVPLDHRLARRRRPIDLAELADERWIAGCPRCEANLRRLTTAAGFMPDIRHRTDDYVVVQRLVAESLAVTLLPQLALTAAPAPTVRAVPVRTEPRSIALVHRVEHALTPGVQALVAVLR